MEETIIKAMFLASAARKMMSPLTEVEKIGKTPNFLGRGSTAQF